MLLPSRALMACYGSIKITGTESSRIKPLSLFWPTVFKYFQDLSDHWRLRKCEKLNQVQETLDEGPSGEHLFRVAHLIPRDS